MTPKEKAKELVQKFNKDSIFWDCYNDVPLEERHDKNCALICVDEIQEHAQMIPTGYEGYRNAYEYFKIVKQEIEKL
tara:strand:- start:1539 stop:1769 length:231 start_codon:yes stop_codon:yes gene_type:complete